MSANQTIQMYASTTGMSTMVSRRDIFYIFPQNIQNTLKISQNCYRTILKWLDSFSENWGLQEEQQ